MSNTRSPHHPTSAAEAPAPAPTAELRALGEEAAALQDCVNGVRLRQGDHRARRLELEQPRAPLREWRHALAGRVIRNAGASVNQTKSGNIGA